MLQQIFPNCPVPIYPTGAHLHKWSDGPTYVKIHACCAHKLTLFL